jgi:hypothetical protein
VAFLTFKAEKEDKKFGNLIKNHFSFKKYNKNERWKNFL